MTPETRNFRSVVEDELFAEVSVAVPWPDCGWNWIEVGAGVVLAAETVIFPELIVALLPAVSVTVAVNDEVPV